METIFDGMSKFETERVYNYGEFKATVIKKNDDEYSINIDSGNYNLVTAFSSDYSDFLQLKLSIEKGNLWDWFCHTTNLSSSDRVGVFDNGRVFRINRINVILNAIKNTYEFLKTHNGSIKNIEEQTFNAGKMVLKYKKIENDVYQCSIEGMINIDDLYMEIREKYENGEIVCNKFDDNRFTIDHIKNVGQFIFTQEDGGYYYQRYPKIDNFKVTTEELKNLKIVLKKCSDRLSEITFVGGEELSKHEINEHITDKERTFNAGKMILKYKQIRSDVYQCSIEGMISIESLGEELLKKYHKDICCYKIGGTFIIKNYYVDDDFKFTLEECYQQTYPDIDNFKVTKEELEKLKIVLKKCSDRLYDLNEKFDIQNICMDFSENRTDIRIYGPDAYKFAIKYYDQMKKETTKY